MYNEEEQRQAVLSGSGGDFVNFLKSCHLQLTISPITPFNVDRVFELAQRTNQLNYAGKRLSKAEVSSLLSGAPFCGLVLSCSDRFGDYGVIGFAVVNTETFNVENFFMSCRVQNRKVDNAFFAWLQNLAKRKGVGRIKVRFTPTGKNSPARQTLAELKFELSDDAEYFLAPVLETFPFADIVSVNDSSATTFEVVNAGF